MDEKYKANKLLTMRVGDEKNEIYMEMDNDYIYIKFNDEEIEIPRDYYLILGAFISKFNKDDFPGLQLKD